MSMNKVLCQYFKNRCKIHTFKMLPEQITNCLIFFDIFGYNSGSTKLTVNQKSAYFFYSLNILMAVFFSLYKFRIIFRPHPGQLIELINQMLQYSVNLYDYWLIILDSIIYKNEHFHFWTYFQHFDKLYSIRHLKLLKYFFKLSSYFILSFLFILAIIFTHQSPIDETVYSALILIRICEIRMFYYILCLEILHFQLKIINEKCTNKKIKLHQLKWIRHYYHCVYEMVNMLNEMFSLSLFSGILFCFYTFLTHLNYVLVHFGDFNIIHFFGESCLHIKVR